MSSIFKMIYRFIGDPKIRFSYLSNLGVYNHWSDEKYITQEYFLNMDKELHLDKPETFNEKMQWLKLHDRKTIYTTMVDKYAVKEYVGRIIGEKYIVPLLGVWNSPNEIDFDSLPQQFVLKTTHDSGGVVICKNKDEADINKIKNKLRKSLRRNYYLVHREWPYKNVHPRIIAEKYLPALGSSELVEYKVFCFNGEPKLFLVCKGKGHSSERTNDFYDIDFKHIPVRTAYPNAKHLCVKPIVYDRLIDLSRKLAKNTYQLRVDFYVLDRQIYFGELTFFHYAGFCPFEPEKYDKQFGDMIQLPINSRNIT